MWLIPRTGEILKGHVTLGSLRVRQDRLLVNALQLAEASGPGHEPEICGATGPNLDAILAMGADSDPVQVALARIRQLAAHEVGHTLGFVHNFAASSYINRASVMDYPAPRVGITSDQQLDFSDAYAVGIGEWDKVAVRYAYQEFDRADDQRFLLEKILLDARERGMIFISDADSRPASAAHPLANLWDNGQNPIDEFEHVLRVRRIALDQFDPALLPKGTSAADVEQYFVPVYLHHRYQVQAIGKVIGGAKFEYGPASSAKLQWESADDQRKALDLLISSLHPRELEIPAPVRRSISPNPVSSLRARETMPSQSGRLFDPAAAIRVAAELVVAELLNAQRLNRVCQQQHGDEFSIKILISELIDQPLKWSDSIDLDDDRAQTDLLATQIVRAVVTRQLAKLVDSPASSVAVRSAALAGLARQKTLCGWQQASAIGEAESDFCQLLIRDIDRILQRRVEIAPERDDLETPPGSPIGSDR